jgi:CheY-like chemotaxis protein
MNSQNPKGGLDGLRKVEQEVPFSVVVADMPMTDLNGIQLLTKIQSTARSTVSTLLTGNAMHAVSEGNIFRFLPDRDCLTRLGQNGRFQEVTGCAAANVTAYGGTT